MRSQYFQVGDWVQKPPGPLRRIVSKPGPYTYKLNDGYTVNARHLRLVKRPASSDDYVSVPLKQARYPTRETQEPDRYIFSS